MLVELRSSPSFSFGGQRSGNGVRGRSGSCRPFDNFSTMRYRKRRRARIRDIPGQRCRCGVRGDILGYRSCRHRRQCFSDRQSLTGDHFSGRYIGTGYGLQRVLSRCIACRDRRLSRGRRIRDRKSGLAWGQRSGLVRASRR